MVKNNNLSRLDSKDRGWYKTLNKSKLTPPGYVFGLVWTVLYILLFVFFVLCIRELPKSQLALSYFIVQMLINVCWTYIFFTKKQLRLALTMIILIIIFTGLCMYEIGKINYSLVFLLVPYVAWLLLASYFNIYILLNN